MISPSRMLCLIGRCFMLGCASSDGDAADAADERAQDTAVTEQAAVTQQSASPQGPAALSVADLDAYERGIAAELVAVRDALEQKRRAKNATDTLEAIVAATESATIDDGARAVGLTVERYRGLVGVVDELLRSRRAASIVAAVPEVDTAGMPEAMRARVRENLAQMQQMRSTAERAYDGMAPDVAAAVRDRAARLDTLSTRLLEARLHAAQ